MKQISLEVISPAKAAYKGNVYSVTVPGSKGNFQVLFNHAPIISSLEIGYVKIKEDENSEKLYAVGGGTVEVLNNKVLILAESFESPEEIDLKRANEAKARAEERLKERAGDIDMARAELSLKRAINRLNISSKGL